MSQFNFTKYIPRSRIVNYRGTKIEIVIRAMKGQLKSKAGPQVHSI